jgi:hypothetical protein
MNDASDRSRRLDALVEEALRAYPVAPAPPSLYPAIMERVRATEQLPPFRLAALDVMVSLAVAVLAGLVFLLWPMIASPALTVVRDPLVAVAGSAEDIVWAATLAGMALVGALLLAAHAVLSPAP